MKIKGEFSILALLMHILLIGVSAGAYWGMSPLFISGEITAGDPLFYLTLPLYALFTLFAVISPFISIKNIYIDDSTLVYKYFLFSKSYNLKDVDGYFTMEIPSKDTTYETIYPVSRNRILSPISSFYLSNYDEVKEQIPLRFIGKVKFSWKNYMLVLLFKKYNELDR
jgi:hypothetical protein